MKNAIDTDRLLDWLVENSVLSIALEGKLLLKNKNFHVLRAVPCWAAVLGVTFLGNPSCNFVCSRVGV